MRRRSPPTASRRPRKWGGGSGGFLVPTSPIETLFLTRKGWTALKPCCFALLITLATPAPRLAVLLALHTSQPGGANSFAAAHVMGWPCNETLGIALLGVAGAERKKEVEEGTKQAAGWGGKVSIMPGWLESATRQQQSPRLLRLSQDHAVTQRRAAGLQHLSRLLHALLLSGALLGAHCGQQVAAACRFRLRHRPQDS